MALTTLFTYGGVTHAPAHTYTQKVESPNGGQSFLVTPPSRKSFSGSVPVRCECHVKVEDKTAKRAKVKLVLASIIALGFMIGEVLGMCVCVCVCVCGHMTH